MNFAQDLIWLLLDMTGGPLPPYLLEIILEDGRSYYVHSPNRRDEQSKSIVLNIYDFRAINEEDKLEILNKLSETNIWEKSHDIKELHPFLYFGRLRCNLIDILYCIEWLSRRWPLKTFYPEFEDKKMGFSQIEQ
jgi:hypothetical protein